MESEFEIRQEVIRLRSQVEALSSIVKDLAVTIRSSQPPMTREEFAGRVGIKASKLRRLIKEGEIVTMPNSRKIPATELRKFDI